jgi:hypothetical protein
MVMYRKWYWYNHTIYSLRNDHHSEFLIITPVLSVILDSNYVYISAVEVCTGAYSALRSAEKVQIHLICWYCINNKYKYHNVSGCVLVLRILILKL